MNKEENIRIITNLTIEIVSEKISQKEKIPLNIAMQHFKESKVYEALIDPETGLWEASDEYVFHEYKKAKRRKNYKYKEPKHRIHDFFEKHPDAPLFISTIAAIVSFLK